MANDNDKGKAITIRIDKRLHHDIEIVARKKDLDMSKLLRRAVRYWIAVGCPEPADAGKDDLAVANN